eukprot:5152558-Pyramimonas_sp.AAC.1
MAGAMICPRFHGASSYFITFLALPLGRAHAGHDLHPPLFDALLFAAPDSVMVEPPSQQLGGWRSSSPS